MPIRRKTDSRGTYYQWGNRGAHYYYTPGNKASRDRAYNRAARQAGAAYAHGYREKKK